jgi:hypothetical protein
MSPSWIKESHKTWIEGGRVDFAEVRQTVIFKFINLFLMI